MLSGIRGTPVRVPPSARAGCRRACALLLSGWLLGQACACVPMTPEALIRAERQAYQQAEREAEFFRDKRACIEFGGFMVIDRRGHASRRDEIRQVPGDRDTWFCRM